jgi:hypothetical protein
MQGWRESHGARMWRFNLTNATAASATQLTPMVLPNIIDDDDDDDGSEEYNIVTTAPPDSPPIVPPMLVDIGRPTSTPTRSMSYQCRAYDLPSVRALVEYHHATMGWPTKAGFLAAIKRGHLRSFPGLTLSAATRYCPAAATPTVMGHMTQVQKGVRSTKPPPPPRPPATPMQPHDLNIKVVEHG